MDELSEEQLHELEEQLYSQVHHQASTFSDVTCAESNQVQGSQTNNKKFISNRYWVRNDESDNAPQKQNEKFVKIALSSAVSLEEQMEGIQTIQTENTKFPPKRNWVKDDESDNTPQKQNRKLDKTEASKTAQPEEQRADIQPIERLAPPGKEKHHKVRNPFATPPKQNPKNATLYNANLGGPFARQAQQLQRVTRFESKKQKSKNARAAMAKRSPMVIETVVLDSSNDSDSDPDVVVVPLPPVPVPVPVYIIDDSDEEENKNSGTEAVRNLPQETTTDAFITPKSKKSSPHSVVTEQQQQQSGDTASRCNSPNSVISQDDFIGQNDRQRLLRSATIAYDTDSLLEPPTPPGNIRTGPDSSKDIEYIDTFIKPTATAACGNSKHSYRLDQSGFGAMDVYESESDIVSDGVYSKGMQKSQPLATTTIRNIDNSSDSELDATTPVQTKTKRLRKRRASGSIKGSESKECSDTDGDEGDGVALTGVPFIARGPPVESCKIKRMRKHATSTCASQSDSAHGTGRTGHMSDSEFMATLNSLAQAGNDETSKEDTDNDDSGTENLSTARDIAEAVINQQEAATSTPTRRIGRQEVQEKSSPIVNRNNLDAAPADIADDIEKLFDKINELKAKKAIELSDEDDCEASIVSHIDPSSDISTAANVAEQTIPIEQEKSLDSNIKYFIGYTPANRGSISDGFGWNEEMCHFYNSSWGGENAREENILRHMNRDRLLWAISDADRMVTKNKRDRREKCINCFSFGHIRARCPKPRKPIMCYMCGESGHQESRCPNTRCLRCGSKTNIFSQSCRKCIYWNNRICPICKLRGHSLVNCPDKWRRYHSTTKPNVFPESRVIYNKRRYCCYCGRRGHLSDDCKKAMYRSEYPMIASEIKSHEKSYEDVIAKPYRAHEIPCRLLFDPKVKVNFDLAAKTTHKLVYGRFLCAVGLGHLIGVKNKEPNPAEPNTVEYNQPSCSLTSNISPEQVSEVSEGTNETSLKETASLQMPPPRTPSHPVHETNEPMDHDSDSNYSFSDHFEHLPTSSIQCVKTVAPLPDFIPFGNSAQEKYNETSNNSASKLERLDKNNVPKLGISAKYVEWYSDEEHIAMPSVLAKDDISVKIPCEAKIYISNEHSKYFQSKLGQEYLSKIMTDNNLKGRLNKTIVGYALLIFGLPADQDKLQRELELKFKSLNDARAQQSESSSEVPKTVNVLIRFVRDSINQLYNNLGNASELFKRLAELDRSTSKNNSTNADRVRRTLNMIFLGQAGLFDGEKHIDTLLKGLQTLLSDFNGSEKTPEDLRNQIDKSWRKLFTPYHHKNYPQLLLAYLKIPPGSRNRMLELNIDPNLLGRTQFPIFMNDEQKVSFSEYSKQGDNNAISNTKVAEESTLLLNVVSKERSRESENKQSQSTATAKNSVKRQENQQTPEKKQQKQLDPYPSSSVVKKEPANLDEIDGKKFQELLSEIAESSNPQKKACNVASKDSETPSMFWSRESLRYIQKLLDFAAEKPPVLQRLQRINQKATAGGLSYNDYSSIIELYNVTIKISKK